MRRLRKQPRRLIESARSLASGFRTIMLRLNWLQNLLLRKHGRRKERGAGLPRYGSYQPACSAPQAVEGRVGIPRAGSRPSHPWATMSMFTPGSPAVEHREASTSHFGQCSLSGAHPGIRSVSWNRQADRTATRLSVLPLDPTSLGVLGSQAGAKGPWARLPSAARSTVRARGRSLSAAAARTAH